jgi:hypothetical protein
MLHWATADYTYWVVSDLGLPELGEFAGLLRQTDSAAGTPITSRRTGSADGDGVMSPVR